MAKKKKATFFEGEENDELPENMPPGGADPFPPVVQQQSTGSTDQMAMMSQMMNTFQSMMQAGAMPQFTSSSPFQQVEQETPEEVSHDIIMPKTIERGVTLQEGLNLHPLYSKLFLNDNSTLLGGIPKGCTITLTGPAYSGKTRSALEIIINAVMLDIKTAYVVAEEGFYDEQNSGRNDLFSRFLEMAVQISGKTENVFRKKYDDKYVIIPNQYHLGKTWADFIKDYRYVVEELSCELTIIDSINSLDPSKLNTVDNLNALKTYNHEKGVTCIVIGQVKDSGVPQGGESLFHTSEVSLHIYEKTMTSKALAEEWGANYRDSINLITARSKVCRTVTFPVKITNNENGLLRASADQAYERAFPEGFTE